ncbi:MAG TPA: phosphoribosyltransferase family protein, partial [Candidatus Tumulicola sp.]|nr:phosphoribosyltransferase family protein [Candidatus Tumulicola sp.]
DGLTPVLVDDIISTGQTMIAAVEAVRQSLPASRPAVCIGVHALFTRRVLDAMLAAGATRVVTTNTVPHISNGIDITGSVAAALRRQLAAPRTASIRAS